MDWKKGIDENTIYVTWLLLVGTAPDKHSFMIKSDSSVHIKDSVMELKNIVANIIVLIAKKKWTFKRGIFLLSHDSKPCE